MAKEIIDAIKDAEEKSSEAVKLAQTAAEELISTTKRLSSEEFAKTVEELSAKRDAAVKEAEKKAEGKKAEKSEAKKPAAKKSKRAEAKEAE